MNNNQNINRELSKSYFKFGLVVICITLAVFAYKSFFGYRDVRMYETYDNCTVTTSSKQHRGSKGAMITTYYVKVVCEDPAIVSSEADDTDEETQPKESRMKVNINYNSESDSEKEDKAVLFSDHVPYEYYKLFRNYNSSKVTMYTTDWGRHYPVSTVDCDKAKAERDYRKLDPPTGTQFLLGIFGAIGLLNIFLGLKSKSVADNYSSDRVYVPDFAFKDKEDALAGMAHARIQREKEEEYRRRERNDRGFY